MADLPAEPTSAPPSGPFQFRLRSIFLLMAITAVAFGLVPQWYRYVIVPSYFPVYLQFYEEGEDPDGVPTKREVILKAMRFAPGFSFIAFVGCCGVWYASRFPQNRKSDFWLGLSFATGLGFLVFPFIWSIPFLIFLRMVEGLLFHYFPRSYDLLIIIPCLLEAALFSCWPVFVGRYRGAMLLFAYRFCYEWFVAWYAVNILIPALD